MNLKGLKASAKTVRALSIDAVEKAKSGHPGLPLGCAEIGSYLFGEFLNHNPKDSKWLNRDRFVLSAGHGSMLLYSLLYLSGFDLTIDDIKKFRQLESKTPGHPEYGLTDGVETSTGPLGQGVGNAVGMAIAGKMNAQKFNRDNYEIFNNRIVVLAGDGDMMEGVSYEACSLAGHLKLNNLILVYDKNYITIEGNTDITFTEDVGKRFEAMEWHVVKIDGHDFDDIKRGFDEADKARINLNKPVIVIAETTIGKGAPNKQGKNVCHGSPLGEEECDKSKEFLEIDGCFYVDPEAIKYFDEKRDQWKKKYDDWNKLYKEWADKFPELKKKLDDNYSLNIPADAFKDLPEYKPGEMIATRISSIKVLDSIVKNLDFVVSGGADLGSSTKTHIKGGECITPDDYTRHNIQYGIREHAMGTIANGLYLYGGALPIVGTFLSFMIYMMQPIRMTALMRIPVIYLYSHDSIFIGEDGPTHQPVEHLAILRSIPDINVLRPADPYEVRVAWKIALTSRNKPNVVITSRHDIPVLDWSKLGDYKNAEKGGYIIKKESKNEIDLIMMASGSEIAMTLDTAGKLESEGYSVRVVSMFSMEIFEEQDDKYKESILPGNVGKRVAVEAGLDMPWFKYVGIKGKVVGINRMGVSAKAKDVANYLGFNAENIYKNAKELLG